MRWRYIHDMFIPRVWAVDGWMATGHHTCAAVLARRDCPFALYSWTIFPSDGEKKIVIWYGGDCWLHRTQPSSNGVSGGIPRTHIYYNVVYILTKLYKYTQIIIINIIKLLQYIHICTIHAIYYTGYVSEMENFGVDKNDWLIINIILYTIHSIPRPRCFNILRQIILLGISIIFRTRFFKEFPFCRRTSFTYCVKISF